MTKNVGGARDKPSIHINRKVTQSIFDAFRHSYETAMPLNVYAVINLRDSTRACPATVFESVRHKYRDWLTYHRSKRGGGAVPPPAYVYALENPEGSIPQANWALHVPPSLRTEFEKKLPQWVQRAQGTLGNYDCDVQDIRASHAMRLAKYIVKGTDPAFLDHFYLRELADEHGAQGDIWRKRAGVSPSLGRVEREKAGFRRRKSRSNRGHQFWSQQVAA